ncbi:LysR family transcriptional regulator [Rhizobium herbae]
MSKTGLLELNAVVAVAATRNFRVAASELGLSPSALSHAVAALEARMGVRLFHRTTRSVSPTAAGEEFLGRIRPALKEIAAAMEAANQFRHTPAGVLRINTSEGGVRGLLMPVIVEFTRRFPDMRIDIVTEGRLVDIIADGFDAGIRLAETVPQDMIAVPLTEEECFAVVASPGYFEMHAHPTTPMDLLAHDCIRLRLPSGLVYRWEFEKRGEEIRLDVTGPLTLQATDLIIEAALAGAGIAYVTLRNAAPYLADGRLVRVLADWTPPFPGLRLYYSGHRHVPAGLRAFIDLMREMKIRAQ